MEAGKACFEADFLLLRLKGNHLLIVFLISMIELWNLLNDPKGQTIKLLFQVLLDEVRKAELVTDDAD